MINQIIIDNLIRTYESTRNVTAVHVPHCASLTSVIKFYKNLNDIGITIYAVTTEEKILKEGSFIFNDLDRQLDEEEKNARSITMKQKTTEEEICNACDELKELKESEKEAAEYEAKVNAILDEEQ